ncbi:glycosyltransferase family 4 protein [Pseudomonas vancouverensis]|uniref:Glycosyltransferase n=1 Tax=Pseudomonas vancouverensis TaxID=95300 RepID=A0A4R4K845_PSEVA|nr:glycosyltransferase family 4 protein [Pseudomonas vancouverensis]TDB62902.1 glycosyltransferase [Pseudomonas vancouverensis]
MKVLHFFKTYYPDTMGGIEQVIFQLAEGGIQQGIEAEVLYLSPRGAMRNEKLANHVTHRSYENFQFASTGFSIGAFRDFAELAEQADIIHYHFPWPFMDMVHFLTKVKKPIVVTYHSDIVKQKLLLKLYSPLLHAFLRNADVIVASSPNYVESSEVLQKYKDKVKVVPIGVDRNTYPEVSAAIAAKWREKLGDRFFLFVGALRYYKGLDFLLEAARKTQLPVVIMGKGPMESDLKLKAKDAGLSNVFFVGALPDSDKAALMSLCFALVFPSHLRSEAFGITLLEGAMYGKPLISCEIGTGTTYINIDHETGLVIPPRDADALANAMRKLWESPTLAAQFGESSQRRYQRLFQADTMVGAYLNIYKDLIPK